MEYYNVIDNRYLNLVRHSVLSPVFKIELLDDYENAYRSLISEISVDSGGSISATYQQGVQKTISLSFVDSSGDFLPNPNNQLFWIGRKFKVYIGLSCESQNIKFDDYDTLNTYKLRGNNILDAEKDYYWFSKGVYILTTINAQHSASGNNISLSGVDKFGRFTSATGYAEMIADFVIPGGMLLSDALNEILSQDDGRGKPIDPVAPIIDPYYYSTRIPYEISKGGGAFVGDIIIELATMFRADVYYDNDGRFTFKRAMFGDENIRLPILWHFEDTDAEYIDSSVDYDLTTIINTVFVVGDNPNAIIAPEAFLENKNAQSPFSVDKIGTRSRLISSSVIQTKQEAEDYAEYMLNQLSRLQQNVPLNTTFIPHLEINNLFTFSNKFYNFDRQEFFIQSITFPIGLGTMSLQGIKIQELPTY
jgi:hypothetical protein